jgi:hypothetical protein
MSDRQLFALVLMPFDRQFDDVYRIGIQEAAARVGLRAERLDEQIFFHEGMMDRLYQQIEEADVIIADLTSRNPNVFYELGYSHAREKLCILITAEATNIPFNVKHRRCIVYESVYQLRDRLAEHLSWAVQQLQSHHPTSPLRADWHFRPGTTAEKEYSIEGEVAFVVDLFNDSGRQATEVHAVYLYVENESWRFVQSGANCGSTASDVAPYTYRHLLSCPVSRLSKGGWAQLQFSGKVVLASRWGDPEPGPLTLEEPALLRLVTAKGHVDLVGVIAAEFATLPPVSG